MLSFMWHLSLEVVFYKATITHLKEKNHTLHTKIIIQRKSTTKGPRPKEGAMHYKLASRFHTSTFLYFTGIYVEKLVA